jgi:integrase
LEFQCPVNQVIAVGVTFASCYPYASKRRTSDQTCVDFKDGLLASNPCQNLRWGHWIRYETISVHRAVTHRIDADGSRCRIDTTKSGKGRTVVVPPHIRADIKAHLDSHTGPDADAPLFVPVRGGCHVNDKAFADSYLKPALKAVGRESVRFHDLRHFAGTMTARVGGSVSETMVHLGHSTSKASLLYQAVDERQAAIADALSKLATDGG